MMCIQLLCLVILGLGIGALCRVIFAKKRKEKAAVVIPEGEYQMVVIINTDLKMSKGKVLSQFGHAIDAAHRHLRKHPELERAWRRSGSAKIALKGTSMKLGEVYSQAKDLSIPRHRIIDAGKTQVPPGSNTCIVLGPSTKTAMAPLTNELTLY